MEQDNDVASIWFYTRQHLIDRLVRLNEESEELRKIKIGDEYIFLDMEDMRDVLEVVKRNHDSLRLTKG